MAIAADKKSLDVTAATWKTGNVWSSKIMGLACIFRKTNVMYKRYISASDGTGGRLFLLFEQNGKLNYMSIWHEHW